LRVTLPIRILLEALYPHTSLALPVGTPAWHPAEQNRPDSLRGGTVLVVDDEASVRRIVRRVLEADGCVVLEAADGESALHTVEQHTGTLDLVITDLVMPGISGREVAEVLSIFRPELAVLGISGYAQSTISDRRLPVLSKPFTVEELLAWARWAWARARPIQHQAAEQRFRARRLRETCAVTAGDSMTLNETPIDLVAAALELQRMSPS
jgi:CheY-like chemotaxis protein